jgi:hypothetical protein
VSSPQLETCTECVARAPAQLPPLEPRATLPHALARGASLEVQTPAAGVWSWFIPFVNLVRPFSLSRQRLINAATDNVSAHVHGEGSSWSLICCWSARRPGASPSSAR